jgi:hypothetical protein
MCLNNFLYTITRDRPYEPPGKLSVTLMVTLSLFSLEKVSKKFDCFFLHY